MKIQNIKSKISFWSSGDRSDPDNNRQILHDIDHLQLPSLEYAEHHQVVTVTGVDAHARHQVMARLVKVEMSWEGSQTLLNIHQGQCSSSEDVL